VRPELAAGVTRLCRSAGYFRVLEAEFIGDEAGHHLLDFNPRYYGQMQFEISRGMPLAVLAARAAQGEVAGLVELAEQSRAEPPGGAAYCFGFSHRLVLGLRRVARTDTAEEQARWRAWYRDRQGRLIDPSLDLEDRLPGVVLAAAELWSLARHARGYLRSYVFDRS